MSGADLEYTRMLVEANATDSSPIGLDGARLEQLGDINAGADNRGKSNVVNVAALRDFKQSLNYVGATPVDVVVISDSTGEGTGANTFEGTWPFLLQESIRQALNIAGGVGYIPAVTTPGSVPPPNNRAGTIVNGGWGLGGRAMQLHDVENHHVSYLPQLCDRVRVWYGKTDYLGGGLRVIIDGVDQGVTLECNGPINSDGHYWDSPVLPLDYHTVVIEPVNAFVGIVDGVEFFKGDYAKGFRVYNASHFGYATSDFLTVNMLMHWQHINAIGPDAVIISLGLNDLYSSDDVNLYLARIYAMISKFSSDTPILLLGLYLRADLEAQPHKKDVWNAMMRGLKAFAINNVAFLDIDPYWPDLTADGSTSEGLMVETINPIHPSSIGYRVLSKLVYNALTWSDGILVPYSKEDIDFLTLDEVKESHYTKEEIDSLFNNLEITYVNQPALTTLMVRYANGAWPERPTTRSDLRVIWSGGTAAPAQVAPPMVNGAYDGDLWIRDEVI